MYNAAPELKLSEFHSGKLGQTFWQSGVKLGIVFLANEMVFHFGPEVLEPLVLSRFEEWQRTKKPDEHIKNLGEIRDQSGFVYELFLYPIPETDVPVFCLLLLEKDQILQESVWANLSRRIHTFLSTSISFKEKTILSFLQILQPIRKKIQSSFSGERKEGVIVYFHLQDLTPFFKPLGVMKSQEILREVMGTLHSITKAEEFSFQINLRSYFIFCPGETVTGATQRFESLYFPSRHLILDYKLKIFPVTKSLVEDELEFSEIFLENF